MEIFSEEVVFILIICFPYPPNSLYIFYFIRMFTNSKMLYVKLIINIFLKMWRGTCVSNILEVSFNIQAYIHMAPRIFENVLTVAAHNLNS